MRSSFGSRFSSILSWLVLAFGALLLIASIRDMADAFASAHWPKTTGTVVQSDWVRHSDTDEMTSIDRFSPRIVYEYTVEGSRYTSSRLGYGEILSSKDRAVIEGYVARFPEGREVIVFHKPGDPGVSVLNAGADPSVWVVPLLGLVALMGGTLGVIFLPKMVADWYQSVEAAHPVSHGNQQDDATRFASLLITEILSGRRDAVARARRDRNILSALGDDIERARAMYEDRVQTATGDNDRFREALVRILAQGDEGALGG